MVFLQVENHRCFKTPYPDLCITERLLTDLPEPDSPTRPKVRPANTSKSMPCITSRHSSSRRKSIFRFRISSKGWDIMFYFESKSTIF